MTAETPNPEWSKPPDEIPLDRAPILCQQCGVMIGHFNDWFRDPCPADAVNGHSLSWPEILLLQFCQGKGNDGKP